MGREGVCDVVTNKRASRQRVPSGGVGVPATCIPGPTWRERLLFSVRCQRPSVRVLAFQILSFPQDLGFPF